MRSFEYFQVQDDAKKEEEADLPKRLIMLKHELSKLTNEKISFPRVELKQVIQAFPIIQMEYNVFLKQHRGKLIIKYTPANSVMTIEMHFSGINCEKKTSLLGEFITVDMILLKASVLQKPNFTVLDKTFKVALILDGPQIKIFIENINAILFDVYSILEDKRIHDLWMKRSYPISLAGLDGPKVQFLKSFLLKQPPVYVLREFFAPQSFLNLMLNSKEIASLLKAEDYIDYLHLFNFELFDQLWSNYSERSLSGKLLKKMFFFFTLEELSIFLEKYRPNLNEFSQILFSDYPCVCISQEEIFKICLALQADIHKMSLSFLTASWKHIQKQVIPFFQKYDAKQMTEWLLMNRHNIDNNSLHFIYFFKDNLDFNYKFANTLPFDVSNKKYKKHEITLFEFILCKMEKMNENDEAKILSFHVDPECCPQAIHYCLVNRHFSLAKSLIKRGFKPINLEISELIYCLEAGEEWLLIQVLSKISLHLFYNCLDKLEISDLSFSAREILSNAILFYKSHILFNNISENTSKIIFNLLPEGELLYIVKYYDVNLNLAMDDISSNKYQFKLSYLEKKIHANKKVGSCELKFLKTEDLSALLKFWPNFTVWLSAQVEKLDQFSGKYCVSTESGLREVIALLTEKQLYLLIGKYNIDLSFIMHDPKPDWVANRKSFYLSYLKKRIHEKTLHPKDLSALEDPKDMLPLVNHWFIKEWFPKNGKLLHSKCHDFLETSFQERYPRFFKNLPKPSQVVSIKQLGFQ